MVERFYGKSLRFIYFENQVISADSDLLATLIGYMSKGLVSFGIG